MAYNSFGYKAKEYHHNNVQVQDFRRTYGDDKSKSKGTYLFIRFPTSGGPNLGVVSHACILATSTVRNCHGRFVGIARKIYESGIDFHDEHRHRDEACVVFLFPNRECAVNFFVSDKNFKQPDFPPPAGHCEAWTVDRYYAPENETEFTTFLISEVRLDKGSFMDLKHYYAKPFAGMMMQHGAHPFVVQTDEAHTLRRFCKEPNTYINVHMFMSGEHMKEVMNDERYDSLQRIQTGIGSEHHSVFTLDPQACP